MEPQGLRFGGGTNVTLLHPLVAVAILVAVALILFHSRKYLVVPLLLAIFFIPKGQVIVLGGAHFTAAKILFLAGLIRWAVSRRPLRGGFNSIDRVFVLWALCGPIVFTLQWMDSQALIKSVGDLLDILGGYFVLRFAIRDMEDVRRTVKVLAVIAIISAVCMISEQLTGSNIFAQLGGMPVTTVRDGKIRSQAAFEVFITAGAYGARCCRCSYGSGQIQNLAFWQCWE